MIRVAAGILGGLVDQTFGGGELSLVVQQAHPGQDRLVRQLGPGLHPRQGVRGCLDAAPFLFTSSQENRGLAVIGMTFQEPVKIASGDPEATVDHLELDRHDRGPIASIGPPFPARPAEPAAGDERGQDPPSRSPDGQSLLLSSVDRGHFPQTPLAAGTDKPARHVAALAQSMIPSS